MRRYTAIGEMFRQDAAAGLVELIATIERCDGNLMAAAHDLDIGRRHLYKLIWREDAWGAVNKIRERVKRRKKVGRGGWIANTQAALRARRRAGSTDAVRTT